MVWSLQKNLPMPHSLQISRIREMGTSRSMTRTRLSQNLKRPPTQINGGFAMETFGVPQGLKVGLTQNLKSPDQRWFCNGNFRSTARYESGGTARRAEFPTPYLPDGGPVHSGRVGRGLCPALRLHPPPLAAPLRTPPAIRQPAPHCLRHVLGFISRAAGALHLVAHPTPSARHHCRPGGADCVPLSWIARAYPTLRCSVNQAL